MQAELGEEKIVSLNVSSNPRPTVVEWNVDGKVIKEGQASERYEALSIKEVETGIWEASLRIKGVEEDDLTKKFDLKLENQYGAANFVISINSSSAGSGTYRISLTLVINCSMYFWVLQTNSQKLFDKWL